MFIWQYSRRWQCIQIKKRQRRALKISVAPIKTAAWSQDKNQCAFFKLLGFFEKPGNPDDKSSLSGFPPPSQLCFKDQLNSDGVYPVTWDWTSCTQTQTPGVCHLNNSECSSIVPASLFWRGHFLSQLSTTYLSDKLTLTHTCRGTQTIQSSLSCHVCAASGFVVPFFFVSRVLNVLRNFTNDMMSPLCMLDLNPLTYKK